MKKLPTLEDRFNRLNVAVKRFKLAVEEATRLIWTDVKRAEKLLMKALKRAEEDGL